MKKKICYLIAVFIFISLLKNPISAYEFESLKEEIPEKVSAGTIFLSGNLLDKDILKVQARAASIQSGVLGISFHLKYEGEKLKFLKYEPGTFLEKGGDPFYLVKNDEKNNKIIFGETLRRDDSFPASSGEISSFYFQIEKGDEFELKFEKGVVSTLDTVRQDIDGITWQDKKITKKNGDQNDYTKTSAEYSEGNSLNDSTIHLSNRAGIVSVIFLVLLSTLLLVRLIKRNAKKVSASVNFK